MNFRLPIILIIGLHFCDGKSYENYTLYRGIPANKHHLEFFSNLSDTFDVNFWREPGSLRMPVDFIISPDDNKSFLKEAIKNGVDLTTIMQNVQSAFDQQTVKTYIRRQMSSFDWINFFKLSDINNWLKDLASHFPNEVRIRSIGKTLQNRDILAVEVVLMESSRRSKVIIEGGIHAREWISPAFVTYMIDKIVRSSTSSDTRLKNIALMYEWYFVPVLNPDGYEHTHSTDRMWRKNLNELGVDLNRNFGHGFGTVGVSKDERYEIYCGKHAMSERESAAMANYVRNNSKNLEYYFSFHSYGQYIIIPYADSKDHVLNHDTMKSMGDIAAAKIKSKHGKTFNVGTAFDTVGYLVGGSSSCWVKETFHVPYVLTFELRDKGGYGFALPTNQILPACEETMEGLLTLLAPRSLPKEPGDGHLHDSQEMASLDDIAIVLNLLFVIILQIY